MTVYVDELRRYPWGPACLRAGACHLAADTEEELHAFAARIGMRRAWFQPRSSPHYDLTGSRRAAALEAGAMFVPAKRQARYRLARSAGATTKTLEEWVAPWTRSRVESYVDPCPACDGLDRGCARCGGCGDVHGTYEVCSVCEAEIVTCGWCSAPACACGSACGCADQVSKEEEEGTGT